jgi:NAD(P)H-dependent FMN reductase
VTEAVRLLLVSGSTRGASTNTAALRTAAAVAPDGVTTTLYDGLAELPAFNPDDEQGPVHPAVDRLRRALVDADAVLFCTPEYAGSLPGSFKNLLDWTVGGGELYGKPVAWVNVATAGRGLGAEDALGVVLGYVGAQVIGSACVRLPVARPMIGPDGVIVDEQVRAGLVGVLDAIGTHLASPAGDA